MRLLAITLTTLLCLLGLGASAKAATPFSPYGPFHMVPLDTKPKMQVWRSEKVLPDDRALEFGIYVDGQNYEPRGVTGNCRYALVVRGLAVYLENCGRSRITVRYFGTRDFTFAWRLGSF